MTSETITSAPAPTGPPRVRRLAGAPAIWALNVVLVGTVAALFLGPIAGLEPFGSKPHLPWWALALAFALAERHVVHLHLRRGAHSFSLAELAIVFGLFFSTPEELVLAAVVGSLPGLVGRRSVLPIKLVFNLAQFALGACVAAIVFAAVAPAGPEPGPLAWLAAFAGTLASAILAVALVALVSSLAEGRLRFAMIAEALRTDLAVTVTTTSLGVAGATSVAHDTLAVALLVPPALMLFVAYRAYLSERRRHQSMEFLYDAARTLFRAREVIPALETLLEQTLDAFKAEMAEVVLFSPTGDADLATTRGPGQAMRVMEPVAEGVGPEIARRLEKDGPLLRLAASEVGGALGGHLAERGVEEVMLAELRGETRVLGSILVAHEATQTRRFAREDLRLLEALATNLGVALEYDRLERSLGDLHEQQRRLEHDARHDPLTSLANRVLFGDRVDDVLGAEGRRAAVLYVDLDNFKDVNDRHGHAAGDALLVAVAERLRACVRPTDTAARLGGDEFALLLAGADESAAVAVAERVLDALRWPVTIGSEKIQVRASVGVATGLAGALTPQELLADADLAMYRAKHGGKGRFEVFAPTMRDGRPSGRVVPLADVRRAG